jgi:Protein of unknown function (DUF3251)
VLTRIGVMGLVAAVLVGALSSQSQKPQTQVAPTQASQKQIDELKSQVALLQTRLKASETASSELGTRVFKLEMAQNAHDSVVLDLTSRKFERLDTDTGMFLVSVEDASPYLDGYRVTLSIGNPSSATYRGFVLHAKWNSSYDWAKYEEASFQKWQKAERTKDDSFTEFLEPGKWNKVDLLLPSTSGTQLGYFLLSMETNSLSLR